MRDIWRIALAVAGGIVIASLAGGVLIPSLIPFAAAYVLAKIARPLGVKLSAACRVSEKVGCTAFAVVLCGAAVYFLVYASGRLVGFAEALIGRIPEFTSRVSEIVSKLGDRFPLFADSEVLPILPGLFSEAASYAAGAIAEALGAIVQGLPESIAGVVFGVVAFVYLMADMPGAAAGVRAILPKAWERGAVRALSGAQSALLSYLRSCLVLMAVTFTCLLVGLWALGVTSPFALSLVISLILSPR